MQSLVSVCCHQVDFLSVEDVRPGFSLGNNWGDKGLVAAGNLFVIYICNCLFTKGCERYF